MRTLCQKVLLMVVAGSFLASFPPGKIAARDNSNLPPTSAYLLIDSSDCSKATVVQEEYDFVPVLKCQFYHPGIVTYALPLFADIDGDGETEIVATLDHSPEGFAIINPNNCEAEHIVDVGGNIDIKDGGPVLGDVDHNGRVDLFLEVDTKIQRWEYNPGHDQMEMIWETAPNTSFADRSHLDILDLNQDGVPELIPNKGYMVNSLTGYVYPGLLPELHTEGKGLFAFTADADPGEAPQGQGNVELIYGTHLYRYDFIEEEWILVRSLPNIDWGFNANVSIADLDLDGDVDAVMSRWNETGEALIWDLQSDELLGGGIFDYPGMYGSRINVANMDSDPHPEMVMTSYKKIFSIDDIVNSGSFGNVLWVDVTTDGSGHTQVTSFDFDGNGTYEITYRDETRMRIFSGLGTGIPANGYPSGPRVLMDSGNENYCESMTGLEYPTIGDIDNDNQAEIVSACENYMSIYESGSRPWGNASKVWNTQAFNVTCVNQDGTIPAHPIENYTLYNNFLAQVNTSPGADTVYVNTPDAIIQLAAVQNDCDGHFTMEFEVCNQGAEVLPFGTPIAIYWRNPTTDVATLIDTMMIQQELGIGECITLPTDSYPAPEETFNIFVVVNDDGATARPYILDASENGGSFPVTNIEECDYTNNLIDSILTMTYHAETDIAASICSGESWTNGEDTYTESGTYTFTLTSENGCDSIVRLELEVMTPIETTEQVSVCEGTSYEFNGQSLTAAGTYFDTLQASSGCDSIVALELNLLPQIAESLEITICPGETYTVGDNTYENSGTFTEVLSSSYGCDSVVQLVLTAIESVETTFDAKICQGDAYEWAGQSYSTAGQYTQTFQTTSGCDSIVHLELAYLETMYDEFTTSVCDGEGYEFAGETYLEAGTYEHVFAGSNGCDSIVTLNLAVLPQQETQIAREICYGETYEFGASELNGTGYYVEVFESSTGCDSTVTLDLLVREPIELEVNRTVCDGEVYEWNGEAYTEPGLYTQTFTATEGCDSIVTLNLGLIPASIEDRYETICYGEFVQIGSDIYSESGSYEATLPTVNGCDSIVRLELAVINPIEVIVEQTICEGEEYDLAGSRFNTEGTYTRVLTASTGCDSIVHLNLKVLQPSHTSLEKRICEGDSILIAGEYYKESGIITERIPNAVGCDSIIEYRLVVLPLEEIWGTDATICEGEDAQLEVFGGADYRWSPAIGLSCIDCSSPIAAPKRTTTYTVTSSGCGGAVIETKVQVDVREVPEVDAGEDRMITPGQSVDLEATVSASATEIAWVGLDGIICQGCRTTTVTPKESTSYRVYASNELGCTVEDEVKVEVRTNCVEDDFFTPNMISPNGDGANDIFYITPEIASELKYLRIYDRWGELIFDTNSFGEHWDCIFRGQPLNPGVYVFYMEVICPDTEPFRKLGNITLLK